MPVGWYTFGAPLSAPVRPRIGRPDRGKRQAVKAGRRAARRAR